jgi:hypothetical protein
MRLALAFLFCIHALIHLLGFFKAFGLTEINTITQPISKSIGFFWLIAFGLLTTSAVLYYIKNEYWWIVGLVAVVLSQILITIFWKDARFGTIINMLILSLILIDYSAYAFHKKVKTEVSQMLLASDNQSKNIISEQTITHLPEPVKNWLRNCGTIGKEPIQSIFLKQDLQMRMKPEQEKWIEAKASQYFTTDPPAFNWFVNMNLNPLIPVAGRDKYQNGQGEMMIKMFSLIPIAHASGNEKTYQATLQRYLAEIVWFPSAALSSYITWEEIDSNSATATMQYQGTEGSGTFHFDDAGNFKKFVAMRYKDIKDAQPTEWTVTALKNQEFNGITIPSELSVYWKLESFDWHWLKLQITQVAYNEK